MLTKETTQLIQEIFAYLGEAGQLAKEDPEACIVALLKATKEDLQEIGVGLEFTVGHAADRVLEAKLELEAKKKLKRPKKQKTSI